MDTSSDDCRFENYSKWISPQVENQQKYSTTFSGLQPENVELRFVSTLTIWKLVFDWAVLQFVELLLSAVHPDEKYGDK